MPPTTNPRTTMARLLDIIQTREDSAKHAATVQRQLAQERKRRAVRGLVLSGLIRR